jgi:hypothetical protein
VDLAVDFAAGLVCAIAAVKSRHPNPITKVFFITGIFLKFFAMLQRSAN